MQYLSNKDTKLMKYIKRKNKVTAKMILKRFGNDKDYINRIRKLVGYIESKTVPYDPNNKYHEMQSEWWDGGEPEKNEYEYSLTDNGVTVLHDFLEQRRRDRLRTWFPIVIATFALLAAILGWLFPRDQINAWLETQETQQAQQEILQPESSDAS